MLWYKSWLDTRFRFLIGLTLLTVSACGIVFFRRQFIELLPMVSATPASGELGRVIQESAELGRSYRGYIFSQWFAQTPAQLGTLFAVLLGSGSLVPLGLKSGTMFTLSLPVSRDQLVRTRAAVGLAELLVIAVVPSLFICAISPAVGERYGVWEAFVHGLSLFVGMSMFFSLAVFFSTIFDDVWRPLLITLLVAVVIGLFEAVMGDAAQYGIFGVMRGVRYFYTGSLPWLALGVFAGVSAASLYAATLSLGRRDF